MMRKQLLIVGLLIFTTIVAFAQNGKLSGYVLDKEKKPIPFATVRVMSGGQLKGGNQAELNGHYTVSPLTPGSYDVEVSSVGFKNKTIKGVTINFETTTSLNFTLLDNSTIFDEVVVTYQKPLVDKDQTSGGAKLTAADIEKMPTRSINALLTTASGVYSSDNGGGLSIRGNREGDNIVFVNGVRQFGGSLPPVEAIEELSVITSGVPAQYGDALGGVISVTTKGAAEKLKGSAFGESSRPFNQWNQEIIGGTLSGPLIKRKAKIDSNGVASGKEGTLLGFFTTLQYNHSRETQPSAVGYWKTKDSALDLLKANPIFIPENVGAFRSIADTFSSKQFEKVKFRPNSARGFLQFNGNLDFQLAENSLFTVGGNFNYSHRRVGGDFNLFNYNNNRQDLEYDYNVFARFRQTFKHLGEDASNAIIKNIFYQVQVDYSNTTQITQDKNLKDDIFKYNYFGKFSDKLTVADTTSTNDWISAASLGDTVYRKITGVDTTEIKLNKGTDYYVTGSSISQGFFNNQSGSGGIKFEPVGLNVLGGNYNRVIDNTYSDITRLSDYRVIGGAVNGESINTTPGYGSFLAAGQQQSGYGRNVQEQYRASLQAGFDIKNHSIKLGAEFEQRVVSNYGAGGDVWAVGRDLVNKHINQDFLYGVNVKEKKLADGSILLIDERPVNYEKNDKGESVVANQTNFDKRLRERLGYELNQFINLDNVDTKYLTMDLFDPIDFYNANSGVGSIIQYQGYDIYGNRKRGSRGNSAFYDFFTNPNKPIDSFRPNYIAGYIEDKFEINDLIVRIGVRVDRFDINQPVLKDIYSFTNLKLAGQTDFSQFSDVNYVKPSTVGDNWAVYVSKDPIGGGSQQQYKVLGYRSGSTWYNAEGAEDNATIPNLVSTGGAFPWYDVSSLSASEKELHTKTGITLDAFKDFKPQINVMPRVAFSFPVSEQTNFFAHYDVLTQRPLSVIGTGDPFDNYGSPLQYYQAGLLRGSSVFLNNPDLKPQKKIDYQVGFDQSLGESSAIRITASYQEIKDLIQVINVRGGYPNSQFRTNGNQDFTTVKGFSVEYTLRRTENFQASANYTLQFAETSASDFAGLLLQTNTPTLRTVVPFNQDQRHAIKLNMDYRIKKGDATSAFGKIFENMGINATFFTGSGLPYTKDGSPWGGKTQIKGGINAGRLPWNNRTSLRIDKNFEIKHEGQKSKMLNVYLYVENVLNAKNVLNVNPRTGSATDDGYLTSEYGIQQTSIQSPSPESYAMYYNMLLMNQDYFNLPRRARIGVSFNF